MIMEKDDRKTLCPLTMGNETSMTQFGFERDCAIKKAAVADTSEVKRYTSFKWACRNCKGKPEELTFINLPKTNKVGVDMAKKGICSICGKEKSLVYSNGQVCTMCENVRSMCRNCPDVVFQQLKQIAPQVIGDSNSADLQEQNRDLARNLAKFENLYVENQQDLVKVEEERDLLKGLVDAMEKDRQNPLTIDRQAIKDLALRLAIEAMRGELESISCDDIELLRSI